ncbi:MAG: hypothetical protein HQM08_29190 [Candidatus Riflebacteria bacterium]|nr:hypothetical protein [Candidatus Riflebacteria bacterium]
MKNPSNEKVLTLNQAAKLLKISPIAVSKLLKKSELSGYYDSATKKWTVKADSAESYLIEQEKRRAV